VIAEFAIEELLDALHQEILAGRPDRVIRFALKEASAKDYVRSAQERILVRPLVGISVSSSGVQVHAVGSAR
jgi:hypothetical protein